MIVQKFGGTSMGSASSIIENVSSIVTKAIKDKLSPVVVVSAMSGVTNQLLEAAALAIKNKHVSQEILLGIKERHLGVLDKLGKKTQETIEATSFICKELENLAHLLSAISIIGELSYRSHDAVMAVGEKLSAKLFSAVLSAQGHPAQYVDLEQVIPGSLPYDSDSYWDEVEVFFANKVKEVPAGITPVLPGFFGPTSGGMLAAVGRGYSDYCASLVGSALKMKEIQIWTDVDGVLSTNPKVVPEAFILEHISYDEMAELAHFGAKVLHPFSVRPAVRSNIPIRILNTFNPSCEGTWVEVNTRIVDRPFKSIAYKKGTTIVRLTTPRMLLTHGFLAQIGSIFQKNRLDVDLIATSEVSISLSVDDPITTDSNTAKELSKLGDVTLQPQQAIVSLVGSEMQRRDGIFSRVFSVLEKAKINVNLISFGNALINLSLVVEDEDCEKAVTALHQEFFPR